MLVSALGHPRLAVAGAGAIIVIASLLGMGVMSRSTSSAIDSGGPADEALALGWMACTNTAFFNRSLTNRPSFRSDLRPLPRVQGRLSEEPTAKRGVDVNQWSFVRQAMAADQARLFGVNPTGSEEIWPAC